jgi:hypothetical protein
VGKLFATPGPCPFCEALGFAWFGFVLASVHLDIIIFFLVATTPIGF